MDILTNIGGIQKIEVALPQFVQISKPDETNTVSVNITGEWEQLETTHGSTSFYDKQKPVKQGFIVVTELEWRMSKISPENHQQAYKFSNRPVIVKVTDNNGMTYIIGTPKNPAYILVERQIPEVAKGWNGYRFSVEWQNSRPAPFVA